MTAGHLASESGPLFTMTAFSVETAGRWGLRPSELPPHHMLIPALHPHRKLKLEELASEGECLPSAPCPAYPTPRSRGRVQSPWVSMALHFGVVNIKPIGLPSSECPETSGTTSKEAGKGTRLFGRCSTWSLSPSRIASGHFLNDQQRILSPT